MSGVPGLGRRRRERGSTFLVLAMSQQSDMADDVHTRLVAGPIPAAHLVRELRSQWGVEHGVGSVHGFVREVATCLMYHDDVEVGDFNEGSFVPWQLLPEEADEKIDAELMAMEAFLDDESKYVFRKRQANQASALCRITTSRSAQTTALP